MNYTGYFMDSDGNKFFNQEFQHDVGTKDLNELIVPGCYRYGGTDNLNRPPNWRNIRSKKI